jgi:hypothetical protein
MRARWSNFASTLCAMPSFCSFSSFIAGALLLALIPSVVLSQVPPIHCNAEFWTSSRLQEWQNVSGFAKQIAILFGNCPSFQYGARKNAIYSFISLWCTELYPHLIWYQANTIVSTPPVVSPFHSQKCSNGIISHEFDIQSHRFGFYCSSSSFYFYVFILMLILLLLLTRLLQTSWGHSKPTVHPMCAMQCRFWQPGQFISC